MQNSKSAITRTLRSGISKIITYILSSYLYKNVLPKMGITKVHYRCDGAGAFDSIVAKSAIGQWCKFTDGVLSEITYKVMVAGCGKVCTISVEQNLLVIYCMFKLVYSHYTIRQI